MKGLFPFFFVAKQEIFLQFEYDTVAPSTFIVDANLTLQAEKNI